MEEIFDIRTAALPVLVERLSKITNQEKRNIIIYEIVYRTYVPFNSKMTFEEMLIDFGYKPVKHKVKKLTR